MLRIAQFPAIMKYFHWVITLGLLAYSICKGNQSSQNVKVTGVVNYNGVIPGPAIVWALEANGSQAAEQVLPNGNGNFSLTVKNGRGYDFKVFVDGTGDGYPQGYEVWKHHADWNNTSKTFNLTQVDGNLTGINFNLWDLDNDNDGFVNWHEHMAGTNLGDANSKPGLDFGLLAHWKFDETNGTVLHDSSGNDLNGTLNGFNGSRWSPGRAGGSLRFDGSDDHVSFPNLPKLNDIRPFSFSGWIKLDDNGSGYVLAKRSETTGYWRFGVYNKMEWLVRQGATGTASLTYNFRPSEYSWEHIVLTWPGFWGKTYIKLYHNGQLATNTSKQNGSGEFVSDANNLFTLGNRPQNNSSYFKGWMDDFRIWERVITPNEVQSIYNASPETNATISGAVSYQGSVPGPFVLWVFDENNTKIAEKTLPNGSGSYSFELPVGHSYDIKAFRDGNGNGNLDVSIGEPYAHWGKWTNGEFEKFPVYGDRNDTDFAIRNSFESWMQVIAQMADASGDTNPADYQVDAFVDQLDRNGATIKSYTLRGVFPTELAAIELDYGTNDAIEEFGVTFAYQYFESNTTT